MPDPAEAGEFSLAINGQDFRFWTSLELTRSLDQVASCSFSAPFTPENRTFRDTFRPYQFQEVEVRHAGRKIFTGTVVNISPSVSESAKTIDVSCYAKCGVWQDCAAPASALPLQFDGLSLDKIAKQLAEPFGLDPQFSAEAVFGDLVGAKFDKVALEVSGTILPFMVKLAQQRGLIITSDSDGNPFFHKPQVTGTPVARLDGNKQPVIGVEPDQDGQAYFSEITGFAKAKRGRRGSNYTGTNPLIPTSAIRPSSFELDDTEPADVPTAVTAKLGRMFAATASYSVAMATHLRPDGQLYEPGDFLSLIAPDAMVYNESKFMARTATVTASADSVTGSLGICLPESFSGELPGVLPWEG